MRRFGVERYLSTNWSALTVIAPPRMLRISSFEWDFPFVKGAISVDLSASDPPYGTKLKIRRNVDNLRDLPFWFDARATLAGIKKRT